MEENIFKPADMHDATFDMHRRIIKRRASGYQRVSKDSDEMVNAEFLDMTWPSGAGALLATVWDLYRFDQALKAGGLLHADSLAVMTQDTVDMGEGDLRGYGWAVRADELGKRRGHSGSISGFGSLFMRYPEQDICIVILINGIAKTLGKRIYLNDLVKILAADQA